MKGSDVSEVNDARRTDHGYSDFDGVRAAKAVGRTALAKLRSMPGLIALRTRMPLIVFLFLALLLLMLVGFACACLTDNPMQAIERVVSALGQVPALTVVWTLMFATLLLAQPRLQPQNAGRGRASPASLQRFRF
jgi:hypothetical protein